jgi:hypothetical protein
MPRFWNEHDVDTIFRRAHRYVDGNELDTIGAFPVLTTNSNPNFDLIFVKETAAITTTFSGIPQSDFSIYPLHQRFGGSDIIHNGEKFVTGFPIHEFRGSDAATILIRPETVEELHVRRGDINIPLPNGIFHWLELVIALINIDTYAVDNHFAGGFIDCYYRDDYHRIFLFKEDYFVRKPIPEWRLNHLTNFRYNLSNPAHQAPLRQAHNRICSIVDRNLCSGLTESDKQKLRQIYYNGKINHVEGVEDPNIAAEAAINGNFMKFNLNFLNNASQDGLTQVVFHEMMHILGYCHPRDPNDPSYHDSIPVKVMNCVSTTGLSPFPFNCNILSTPPGRCP